MNLCDTCKRRNPVLGYCENRDFYGLQEGVDIDNDLEHCEAYEPEEGKNSRKSRWTISGKRN